jgi:hypothetical protein
MKRFFFFAILCFLICSCGQSVQNFVDGELPNVPSRGPASLPAGPMSLKTSQGNVQAQSSTMSIHATVSPTNRTVTSSNMSLQFSVHQEQTTP